DQLAGHRPDDVYTENFVVVLSGHDLAEPGGLFHRACTAAREERERADFVGTAALLHFFFGLTDPRDFRGRVDHRRDDLVVHFGDFAGDQVRDHDALFLALVRQHRAAHQVADRPYVRDTGLAVVIDFDEAAFVDLHARAVRQQRVRVRTTA